jgi:hypothetical protein
MLRLDGALRVGVRVTLEERDGAERVMLRFDGALRVGVRVTLEELDGADRVIVRLGGALRVGVRDTLEELDGAVVRGVVVLRDRMEVCGTVEVRVEEDPEEVVGRVMVRLGGALRVVVRDTLVEFDRGAVVRGIVTLRDRDVVGADEEDDEADGVRDTRDVDSPVRVRGVAGTPELVVAAARGLVSPLPTERDRIERAVSGDVAERASLPPRSVRGDRSPLEPLLEPSGATRLPPAAWMASEVVGEAERLTATLLRRAARELSVMGVRSMRPPVRSTGEKSVRRRLDCNSALRAEAVTLRGEMVSSPRMTRRGE